MPSIKQDVILRIAGNLKAFLKLELGVTRGELPAPGNGSAQEQELRRARARITQQKRQIKQLRRRQRHAGGGRQSEKKDGRIKKLRGQFEGVREQLEIKKRRSQTGKANPQKQGAGKGRRGRPPVGKVDFGSLRRLKPVSTMFGYDRGRPVDRYYIENFLAYHAEDIKGRVLEVGDDSYTRQFGGGRVEISDVLHVTEGNPQSTIVADLTRADHVPSGAFDCIIFTQTLQFIYDVRLAIQTLRRILSPGGVLLATVPSIGRMLDPSQDEWDTQYYWAFTPASVRSLFEESFPATNVEVEAHGNVLAAISFLHGLAAEELREQELKSRTPGYEVIVTVRAVKPGAALT
jgi:SAM-dependent methyltransferase